MSEPLTATTTRAGDEREAFLAWMLDTAKCVVGSSDPYAAGLERDYWRVWQAALSATERGVTDMRDAYVGAREDLAIWKRRALEAEAKLREAANTNRLTVTPAMVKAAMPWLENLHHMRKTDKESNVEEALRAVFAIIAATEGK